LQIETFNEIENFTILCTNQLERWYLAPDVRQETVHVGRIRGNLFIPKGSIYMYLELHISFILILLLSC
jgi:hypothetical protein